MEFQVSSRRENRQRNTLVIKGRVLENVLANNFAVSDAEDNTWAVEQRRCSRFAFVETPLAICKMSEELIFWEVMYSFVFLALAGLAALLACLNFALDSEDLFCCYKRKKWFLWTMAAAQAAENHGDEAWPNIYIEEYIHQFQPEPLTKFISTGRNIEF